MRPRRRGGCCTCTGWGITPCRCYCGTWQPSVVCGCRRVGGSRCGGCRMRSCPLRWPERRRRRGCRWRRSILGPPRWGRTAAGVFLGVVHAQPVTGAVPDQHAEVDFAAVTYLHKLGFDLDWRLPELFPRGELSIALDLADALLPVQVMQVGQDLFGALDRR